MRSLNETTQREWNKIVEEAYREISGTCPLIEDETIILVNDYIKKLEEYKFMYEGLEK